MTPDEKLKADALQPSATRVECCRYLDSLGIAFDRTQALNDLRRRCRREANPTVPWVEVDQETAYGSTQRSSRSYRVF